MAQIHHSPNVPPQTVPSKGSAVSLLLRIFWMLAGYMVIALSGLSIAMNRRDTILSPLDPLLWLIAVLMIAARYIDITRYAGTTSDGEPATLTHWRRYSMVVAAVAAAVWLAAHAVNHFSA